MRTEHQHLEQANEHIAEAERMINHQLGLIGRLQADGHDVKLAKKLLNSRRRLSLLARADEVIE
jgi:hypothetical protein